MIRPAPASSQLPACRALASIQLVPSAERFVGKIALESFRVPEVHDIRWFLASGGDRPQTPLLFHRSCTATPSVLFGLALHNCTRQQLDQNEPQQTIV